ncbi:Fusaric acid cluster transcription factor FUB10 [Fusarium oxysporum f. sp. albedinis]|nr:Fusaric acid cluster transcription factor FUB10 [Fusarium oxysporum f. sp. albedinis]
MLRTGLTTSDVKLITIIQQVCSVLSLVGCLFIIATFCLCDAFHKPINRLVFYASFGNIMASICFIMADSFIREPDGAGCQTQAFLLHTFVGADALWTLAMAINVYLAFYYRFDAQRLRKMELPYLILCYGIPFLPAFIFIFIRNGDGDRVYGSAVQWCWIAPSWDALRIATFYGPIWGVIAITLAIYIRSGGTIYRKRQQLLKAQASGSGSGGLSYANQSTINNMKTTEVTITREAAGETNAVELQSMGHQASVHPTVPRPPGRVSNDVYRAAWAYTKVAMLFFAVILITWIPSSANRMYSHIHPKEVSKPLQFMSAIVLPLQGFWNAVIYAVTSWASCKALLEERGFWGSRTRINEPANWEVEESRSNRRSKLKTMLNSRTEDSESLRELAYPTKSDDGRSV